MLRSRAPIDNDMLILGLFDAFKVAYPYKLSFYLGLCPSSSINFHLSINYGNKRPRFSWRR